ncbi:MAG: IS200/IS605 family transposase [Planctomycetota bacterium]
MLHRRENNSKSPALAAGILRLHAKALIMIVEEYTAEELNFAYCYRVYFRWHSYRNRSLGIPSNGDYPALETKLNGVGVHLLEANQQHETDLGLLVSLKPVDSVAVAASKLKGRASKWMREDVRAETDGKMFGRGYFAATFGQSNREEVMEYLDIQGNHHDYIDVGPTPVYTEMLDGTAEKLEALQTSHAATKLLFHIVLSTQKRLGFFSSAHGRAMAETLKLWQEKHKYRLLKMSFVPDHVHIALAVHPTVAPEGLITTLMNKTQDFASHNFSSQMVKKGLERLWQPSAYLGSFGDITSAAMRQYVVDW